MSPTSEYLFTGKADRSNYDNTVVILKRYSTYWGIDGILCSFMTPIDNGGARAINGFNYQKSVIILIAVLHYLSGDDFEIYVEAKDDIIVRLKSIETYIQVKGKKMSVGELTKRPDNKDSILEKNHANGDENSLYKVISPEFANSKAFLEKTSPIIFKKGAEVFTYTKKATDEINKKLTGISEVKLNNSRIVLTSFKADIEEALTYIKGVMNEQDIQIDNGHGIASLEELCLRIDQSSARIVKDPVDIEKKKFTSKDLALIFRHTYKAKCFEDALERLGYNTAKKEMIKNKRSEISALYKSYYNDSKSEIAKLDYMELSEEDILDKTLATVDFNGVEEELSRIAIVLDAYSQIIFDKRINV